MGVTNQQYSEVLFKLAAAEADSRRLSHIIDQTNRGEEWIGLWVFEEAAEMCPGEFDEDEEVQKWVRAVIDADMQRQEEKNGQ
jgi:hypothetical protein